MGDLFSKAERGREPGVPEVVEVTSGPSEPPEVSDKVEASKALVPRSEVMQQALARATEWREQRIARICEKRAALLPACLEDPRKILELPALPFGRMPSKEEMAIGLMALTENPTPREWIRYFPAGKEKVEVDGREVWMQTWTPYIPIHVVRDILNRVFGRTGWTFIVDESEVIQRGKDWEALVRGRLRVTIDGQTQELHGTGGQRATSRMTVGAAMNAAESRAIVKALQHKMFDDVYRPDMVIRREERQGQAQAPPSLSLGRELQMVLEALGCTTAKKRREAILDYVQDKFADDPDLDVNPLNPWRSLSPEQKHIVLNHFRKELRKERGNHVGQ